jgi:hypothetical protein
MTDQCVAYVTSSGEIATPRLRREPCVIRVLQTMSAASRMSTSPGRAWEAHNGTRVR